MDFIVQNIQNPGVIVIGIACLLTIFSVFKNTQDNIDQTSVLTLIMDGEEILVSKIKDRGGELLTEKQIKNALLQLENKGQVSIIVSGDISFVTIKDSGIKRLKDVNRYYIQKDDVSTT